MMRRCRKKNGNILAIVLIVICLLMVPLFFIQSQLSLYFIDSQNVDSVVDAACLIAANDLSRIVVNDRHFGYVSLSNHPPIGQHTRAADGDPLPVTGINTLVGTIRQNMIIARELGNRTMLSLARDDRLYLNSTIIRLNSALTESLKSDRDSAFSDIHGNKVKPVRDVSRFLVQNLPGNVKLVSVRLTNGWLAGGDGTTTIDTPRPERFANLREHECRGGLYKPFIDLPVYTGFSRESFTFAGLGPTSRLVTVSRFRRADRRHINSIVRLECIVERTDPHTTGLNLRSRMKYVSCSQPNTLKDAGPKGVMTMKFTGGTVSGLQSWSDLLSDRTFSDRRVTTFRAVRGDYPVDPRSVMRRFRATKQQSTAQHFAEHLYCWLRNGNLRPRVDSVFTMINQQFKNDPGNIYIYEFATNGSISRRLIPRSPFLTGVTSDRQLSVIADTRIQGGVAPLIIMKNHVRYLGTEYGGKHAGQPLAGEPLNWCEIGEYGGDENLARSLGKGRLASQLIVSNLAPPGLTNPNIFSRLNGGLLAHQPRRSYYSGGSALDIEIGGTRACSPKIDVERMRKLSR